MFGGGGHDDLADHRTSGVENVVEPQRQQLRRLGNSSAYHGETLGVEVGGNLEEEEKEKG